MPSSWGFAKLFTSPHRSLGSAFVREKQLESGATRETGRVHNPAVTEGHREQRRCNSSPSRRTSTRRSVGAPWHLPAGRQRSESSVSRGTPSTKTVTVSILSNCKAGAVSCAVIRGMSQTPPLDNRPERRTVAWPSVIVADS